MTEMIRMDEVVQRVGLSRSLIYRLIKDDQFPAPVKLTAKTSAWVAGEVDDWLQERINQRAQAQ